MSRVFDFAVRFFLLSVHTFSSNFGLVDRFNIVSLSESPQRNFGLCIGQGCKRPWNNWRGPASGEETVYAAKALVAVDAQLKLSGVVYSLGKRDMLVNQLECRNARRIGLTVQLRSICAVDLRLSEAEPCC